MITELYHQESSENCISLIYLGRIGSAWPALIWYIWIKVLTTIPYSLLYAATMNMEIIVPSLVILVGTRALFYLFKFIIRNFSFKCSIFTFIHFCCCVIFHKKLFSGRDLTLWPWKKAYMKKFPCGICEKAVAANHYVVCCDICITWVHISCNSITRYCYRKLQKDETPCYCKICIRQVMSLSNLTNRQLEAFILGKLITSPKLILANNQLLFPNNYTENILKNQYLTPSDFYKIQNTRKSKQLSIYLNISQSPITLVI